MQYQGEVLMQFILPLLWWLEKSTYLVYINLKHPNGDYSVSFLFYFMD